MVRMGRAGRDRDLLHAGTAGVSSGQRMQSRDPGRLRGDVRGPLPLVHIHRAVDQISQHVTTTGHRDDCDVQPGGGEIAVLLGDIQARRTSGRDHSHRQVRFLHGTRARAGAAAAARRQGPGRCDSSKNRRYAAADGSGGCNRSLGGCGRPKAY